MPRACAGAGSLLPGQRRRRRAAEPLPKGLQRPPPPTLPQLSPWLVRLEIRNALNCFSVSAHYALLRAGEIDGSFISPVKIETAKLKPRTCCPRPQPQRGERRSKLEPKQKKKECFTEQECSSLSLSLTLSPFSLFFILPHLSPPLWPAGVPFRSNSSASSERGGSCRQGRQQQQQQQQQPRLVP